jgi:predicted nucleic acid-binding Zn ribbon protein
MKLHFASLKISLLCKAGIHTFEDGAYCCNRCKKVFSEEEITKQNQHKEYILLTIVLISFCLFIQLKT